MSRLLLVIATPWLAAASPGLSAMAPKGGHQALQVVRTVEPTFPVEMIQRDVRAGQARVTVLIDADGRMVDRLVTAYTHVAFAREAIEALDKWQFVPARRNGQPVPVRTELQILFKRAGQVASVDGLKHLEQQFESRAGDRELTVLVAEAAELDEPLRAEQQVEAAWPEAVAPTGRDARVTLDFYIDGYGRPRLITVIGSDGDAFSRAAMLTLMQWRYQAPLRRGEPTLVHTVQEIVFAPPR